MASKASAKAHILLSLNLLYYVLSTLGGASATLPGGGVFATPPCSGGSVTPPGNGGSATPPGNGGSASSPGSGGSASQGNGGSTTPPGSGGSAPPPGKGGSAIPPEKGGSMTPPGSGGSAIPPGTGTGGFSISPSSGSGGFTTRARCPRDALKLGVCANLLGSLFGVVVGKPPTRPCCRLVAGLVDLEAAVCLCTVIRANVIGIKLNVPLSLNLLLNVCGRTPPMGFIC